MRLIAWMGILMLSYYSYGQKVKLRYPKGHIYDVTAAEISPNGEYLISSSWDNHIFLWEVRSGKFIGGLKKTSEYYDSDKFLRFSPDGNYYVALLNDDEAMISDLRSDSFYSCMHTDSLYTYTIHSMNMSPDGSQLLTASADGTIALWDMKTGKLIAKKQCSKTHQIFYAEFSPDGKKIAVTSQDKDDFLSIWSVAESGEIEKEKSIKGIKHYLFASKFSPDGQYILSIGENGKNYISDVLTGRVRTSIKTKEVVQMELFSPDDKHVFLGSGSTIEKWHIENSNLDKTINHNEASVNHLSYTPDDKFFVTAVDSFVLFKDTSGQEVKRLKFPYPVNHVSFKTVSSNGQQSTLFTVTYGGTIALYDLEGYKLIQTFKGRNDAIWDISQTKDVQPDHLTVSGFQKNIFMFDRSNGKIISSIKKPMQMHSVHVLADNTLLYELDGIHELNLSSGNHKLHIPAEGKTNIFAFDKNIGLLICKVDNKVGIYNYHSESNEFTLEQSLELTDIHFAALSKEGKRLMLCKEYKELILLEKRDHGFEITWQKTFKTDFFGGLAFDVKNGVIFASTRSNGMYTIHLASGKVLSVADENAVRRIDFIQTSGKLLTYAGNHFDVWEFQNDSLVWKQRFEHDNDVSEVIYDSIRNQFNSVAVDGNIRVWNAENGELLIRHIQFDNDALKWVQIHTSGLFDASPEAMELMYWTKGLEVIEFDQLKDRYWVPGLWEKVMKGEALPDARNMQELKLQPVVELGEIKDGKIPVTITKREGGYGKVSILINGKEIQADARGSNFDKSKETQTIWVDLKDHPNLQNGENSIAVKASSEDGFVVGRPVEKKVTMNIQTTKPHFYAVVIGTGKYTNSSINLKYPEKDAQSMSTALQLGSEQLFGKENTHIYTLTTASGERPTKEKIKTVFTEIGKNAKSSDVILVYLSGHGIAWGGDHGDFYYITTDATAASADAYNDEVIRKNYTISATEFTDYLKAIPANKQVMIIDACSSGKAVDNLMAARDIDVSSIKAIDRMKDRTGMFVISGSAADAVSYEASRYGQGLLTYSILQAMKGAALRDGQFFDVNTILNYSRENVPKLAAGIGGIQTPQLLVPKGGSFDIGKVDEAAKTQIPLSNIKPVFVRTSFMDSEAFADELNLSKSIDDKLNQIAMRGADGQLVFLDTREFPDAYRLSGGYTQFNGTITLKLKIKGPKESEHNLSAKTKEELAEKVLEIVEGLE
jgi:WD40 repeat protein